MNELDPKKNLIDKESIRKFLGDFDPTYMDRSRPKGPDHLIIDNFLETFKNLKKDDLISAKNEAEQISSLVCDAVASDSVRCDNLLWLKNLESQKDEMPGLNKIAHAMKAYREMFNENS